MDAQSNLSLLLRPNPRPLGPKPTAPAPSPPCDPGQGLEVTSHHRLTCRPHTARHAPPLTLRKSRPAPRAPPRRPPPPLTLASNLRMMVSRKVFCGATWPSTGILSPWAGLGGPPPPRPGPAQHRLRVARPGRGPRTPAARQSTGAAWTGLRARPSARSRLDRGPGLSSAARTPVCRPQPEPRVRLPRPRAARPPERAPGSQLPPAAPTAASAPAAWLQPAAPRPGRGRVNAARAPRAPAPASRPSRLPRARSRPSLHTLPRARPSYWLTWPRGSPPQPLAQPRSPRDSRAPKRGKGPLGRGTPEVRAGLEGAREETGAGGGGSTKPCSLLEGLRGPDLLL